MMTIAVHIELKDGTSQDFHALKIDGNGASLRFEWEAGVWEVSTLSIKAISMECKTQFDPEYEK